MKTEKNMGYEDRFERYLNGELETDEAREIEAEVEKFQVLMSYADRMLDDELLDSAEDIPADEGDISYQTDLSREISRVINRKFRRCVTAAAAIAVSIVFVLLLGLSPLLDRIFYNPSETLEIVNEADDSRLIISPFVVQMAVYMELFCGDKGFAEASSWREGYGRYTINVNTQIDGVIKPYTLELVRNHLYQGDLGWKHSDFPDNAFTYRYGEDSCSTGREEALRKLADIPESMKIRAAVSFQDVKNMEELVTFMKQHETSYLYCPIVTEYRGYWGFSPKYIGYNMTDCYDQEKYPYLDIFQYEEGEQEITLGEVYEKHVQSMISYLMEQEDFLKIFDSGVPGENIANTYKYRAALDDIKEHGVHCYGTVVYASKQELEDILEDPEVSGIYMLDGRVDMN